MEDALPRPVAKYLAGLPPEPRKKLASLVAGVYQALNEGAALEPILELLAANPVEPAEESAIIEALARFSHPLLPAILQAGFGGTADRTCQKALKKAFHLLRTQGVEIPYDLAKAAEGSVVKPLAVAVQSKGYTSRIDGNGNRLVVLQLPRQGQSFNLVLALCNDLEGLKDTYAVLLSNKEAKKYLATTKEDIPGDLIEMPPAYIFKILEESFQAHPDESSESGATYLRVRPVLKNLLGQESPADIPNLLPVLDDREEYLKQSRKLSLEEEFLNWHFSPEELNPWLTRIQEIEQSPLVLTSEQKVARIEDTVAEAIKELVPPEKRRLISRRLLEMAYYLDHTGKPHLARQAQAAGEDLERERSPLERENPFLLGLLMFPLRGMYDEEKKPEPADSQAQGRILTGLQGF
jgi:hypothetical protein